jgi:nucleoside-diphosphate-sugar epimerase
MSDHHLNVAVLGCGYIGSAVAKLWRARGIHVTGTTRRPDRLKSVVKVAQKGILLKGNDESDFAPIIEANEVILVTIGADRPEDYDSAYRHTAQVFRNLALEMDLPRRLIYTSSTSIYGDHHGRFVDEESDLLSKTDNGKILIETERIYHSLTELGWQVCTLRLAEVYGPERELSTRVKQNEDVALAGTGEQYTNMVHRDDCASAIDYLLRHHHHHHEGIYNLADDEHPTRKELYDKVAKLHHLKTPHWDLKLTSMHSGNKRVSNHKIKASGFTFRYPHRILD